MQTKTLFFAAQGTNFTFEMFARVWMANKQVNGILGSARGLKVHSPIVQNLIFCLFEESSLER